MKMQKESAPFLVLADSSCRFILYFESHSSQGREFHQEILDSHQLLLSLAFTDYFIAFKYMLKLEFFKQKICIFIISEILLWI